MIDSSENIIKVLGIESLPDEQKARIIDQANELIQERLFVRLLEMLSEEKREGFNQILQSGDQDALTDYIAKEAPNFNDWILEEVVGLKQELRDLGQVE